MTKAEAIAMLKRIQEPEAWEPQINKAAFEALDMAIEALSQESSEDVISRQAAIDAMNTRLEDIKLTWRGKVKKGEIAMYLDMRGVIETLPSAQPEIIRCKDCKHWRQQTNYQGAPLSFGFCESDDMWRSLYGETYEVSHIDTDDDFYCGYAERRTDGSD